MQIPLQVETARALIEDVRARAIELGKPLSIAVVDHAGFTVLFERMNGARPMSSRIATAKAYSATIMQRPTLILERLWTAEPVFYQQISDMAHQPLMAAPGGYPLKLEGVILGGIGTSGASGEEDHHVVEAAVAASGFSTDF